VTVAEVAIVPDTLVEVKETLPVALIASVPVHSIAKWKLFPE